MIAPAAPDGVVGQAVRRGRFAQRWSVPAGYGYRVERGRVRGAGFSDFTTRGAGARKNRSVYCADSGPSAGGKPRGPLRTRIHRRGAGPDAGAAPDPDLARRPLDAAAYERIGRLADGWIPADRSRRRTRSRPGHDPNRRGRRGPVPRGHRHGGSGPLGLGGPRSLRPPGRRGGAASAPRTCRSTRCAPASTASMTTSERWSWPRPLRRCADRTPRGWSAAARSRRSRRGVAPPPPPRCRARPPPRGGAGGRRTGCRASRRRRSRVLAAP